MLHSKALSPYPLNERSKLYLNTICTVKRYSQTAKWLHRIQIPSKNMDNSSNVIIKCPVEFFSVVIRSKLSMNFVSLPSIEHVPQQNEFRGKFCFHPHYKLKTKLTLCGAIRFFSFIIIIIIIIIFFLHIAFAIYCQVDASSKVQLELFRQF